MHFSPISRHFIIKFIITYFNFLVRKHDRMQNIKYIPGYMKYKYYAANRKVAGSNPDEIDFFNLPNPSSRTMALWTTQPLTEMSTRNLPGGKGRPARKADKLTAICEPIV
jgi:hypothetical protein